MPAARRPGALCASSSSASGKPRPRLRCSTPRRGTCVRRPSRRRCTCSPAPAWRARCEPRAVGWKRPRAMPNNSRRYGRRCSASRWPAFRWPPRSAGRGCRGRPRSIGLRCATSRPHDAWWTCAQGELWLLDGKGQPPKELWACVRAEGKPRLDGRLDEPFWRSSASVRRSAAHSTTMPNGVPWPCWPTMTNSCISGLAVPNAGVPLHVQRRAAHAGCRTLAECGAGGNGSVAGICTRLDAILFGQSTASRVRGSSLDVNPCVW